MVEYLTELSTLLQKLYNCGDDATGFETWPHVKPEPASPEWPYFAVPLKNVLGAFEEVSDAVRAAVKKQADHIRCSASEEILANSLQRICVVVVYDQCSEDAL